MGEEYPSNSFASRNAEQKASIQTENHNVEKLTTGKKKTHLADKLLVNDWRTVLAYVGEEILWPAVKHTISDAVSGGLDKFLFENGDAGRRHSGGRNKDYTKKFNDSSSRDREPSRKSRVYDKDMFEVNDRLEGEKIMKKCWDLIEDYGCVTVSDMCTMTDTDSEYTDGKFGWFNLDGMGVVRRGGRIFIQMPEVKALTR